MLIGIPYSTGISLRRIRMLWMIQFSSMSGQNSDDDEVIGSTEWINQCSQCLYPLVWKNIGWSSVIVFDDQRRTGHWTIKNSYLSTSTIHFFRYPMTMSSTPICSPFDRCILILTTYAHDHEISNLEEHILVIGPTNETEGLFCCRPLDKSVRKLVIHSRTADLLPARVDNPMNAFPYHWTSPLLGCHVRIPWIYHTDHAWSYKAACPFRSSSVCWFIT